MILVERTVIGNYLISTICLEVGYRLIENIPFRFETMVFKGSFSELEVDRYTTWDEAVEGHKSIVDKYRELAREENEPNTIQYEVNWT